MNATEKFFSVPIPSSILHDVLVGAGSLWVVSLLALPNTDMFASIYMLKRHKTLVRISILTIEKARTRLETFP
jgi:hypothetical protein